VWRTVVAAAEAGRPFEGDQRVGETLELLLVEDNIDDVELLKRLARRCSPDWSIRVVATGHEALEAAASGRFDAALVDQHLPDVSGEHLIPRLQAITAELPVVMLTRQGDERLAVEVMKAGAYDYLRKDDLNATLLGRTVRNVVERARLEAEVRRADERLREWAIRDGLTGLFNHRHFQELLRTEWARAVRYAQPLACLMLDLDHFKQVNDTYGHPFGDEVLKHLARVLGQEARKVDVVARYGGEEFVLLLPSTDVVGSRVVAERICSGVAAVPFVHEGTSIALTLSIGVATSEDPRARSESELVKLADAALYRAKRSGRNRVCMALEPGGPRAEALPTTTGNFAFREHDAEIRRMLVSLMTGMLGLIDARDGFGEHSLRVARLAVRLGQRLNLEATDLEVLRTGALLHDIGRVAVPDEVWLKTETLSPAERERVRQHAVLGAKVLESVPFLERERHIARHHHERWDGQGYPDGLSGAAIPALARIVGVCDAYEALTSRRPWRAAKGRDEALAVLEAGAGREFDPALVPLLAATVREAGGEV
jgi:diguanylate cyclase (GGDEF)-like protein/putative nucleotidyltransferase with HDIG domain